MSGRAARSSTTAVVACGLLAAAALAAAGETEPPAAPAVLPFHRVLVPEGRLPEIPLGEGRLVPMPLAEFEAALGTASGAAAAAEPRAEPFALARYRAVLGADGRLDGVLTVELGPASVPAEVGLGGLPVDRGSVTDDEGTVAVAVFARAGRGTAASVPRGGTCSFHWKLAPEGDERSFVIPLVPAVRSSVTLVVPAGLRPVAEGGRWVRPAERDDAPEAAGGAATSSWRVECGPVDRLALRLVAEPGGARSLSCWQTATILPGQLRVAARVVPATPWRSAEFQLAADERLVPENATAELPGGAVEGIAAWGGEDGSRRLRVRLPAEAVGTRAPVTLRAAAPLPSRGLWPADWLPLPWPEPAEWGGGGVIVECEPGLAVVDVELDQAVPVSAEIAASWPVPAAEPATAEDAEGARLAIEAQGPQPRLRAGVAPSIPDLDIARVTTVDVGAASVLGRAACDVRVRRGSAFELVGRVGGGWFVDAVEAAETLPSLDDGVSAAAPGGSVPIDWRVVRDDRGATLRVALPTAATKSRGLVVRVTGHRAGVDTETPFACRDMDMLRLEGETDGAAVLVLASPPETTIELESDAPPPVELPERLAALAGTVAARAWIPADSPALAGTALLLERRSAVEGTTRVVLTCRDDRLAESFTFTCRPGAAALDAVVVHFPQPTDDQLEWSLLPPAQGRLAVRRMATAGDADRGAETWLLEFQPPLRDEAGVRATRSYPFTGAMPVPLAWIEGSRFQGGSVSVVNAGRRRPVIVNRRLAELPPVAGPGADGPAKGTLAEFAYRSDDGVGPGGAAAEVVPGGRDRDEDARAWVWSERSTCWCFPTGVTEYETAFDVENHGRTNVALTLPATLVARGVVVDGVPAPAATDPTTGSTIVDLPAERRFVRIAVRSEAEVSVARGAWRVGLASAGIDVPVLERVWHVMLPDGVELLSASGNLQAAAGDAPGWLERLLPVAVRRRPDAGAVAAAASGTIDAGFRRLTWASSSSVTGGEIVLVHAGWTWAAALATWLALAAFAVVTRRRMTRLAVAVALAVGAMWIVPPFDGLARAGLWGLAAAAVARWAVAWWRTAPVAVAALLVAGAAAGAGEPAPPSPTDSLPVYVVPAPSGRGGDATALVPEPLFRALSLAAGRRAGERVRILSARLLARPGTGQPWSLAVEIDAEPGSLLSLAQTGDATWDSDGPRIDGVATVPATEASPALVRLGFPAGGRHLVETGIVVAPVRRGDVESAVVSLPAAPRAEVVVEGPLAPARGGTAAVQVEAVDDRGTPRVAPAAFRDGSTVGTFAVDRAGTVRVAWAADGRTPLADAVPVVESTNDIRWSDDGCRLAAGFRIESADAVVRRVVVRSDPRLGPIRLSDPGLSAGDLGGGRHLVTAVEPRRGRWSFAASFEMPLADAVGATDVPSAWIEAAVADTRTVQVFPSGDLVARVTLPEDATAVPPRDASAPAGTVAWRCEAGRGTRAADEDPAVAAAAPAGRGVAGGTARMVVERRRVAPRGSQRVAIAFDRDQTRVRLLARIDAPATPLVTVPVEIPPGCDVERATLRAERAAPAAADALDVRWNRVAAGRLLAVVQRPRTGSFVLEVVAVLPGAPPERGGLPLSRVALEPAIPAAVTWTSPPGRGVEVGDADDGRDPGERTAPAAGGVEVAGDAPPPAYRFLEVDLPASEEAEAGETPGGDTVAPDDAGPQFPGEIPRVELAETHLAIDLRGRAWGVSRFDVVAGDPLVRIRIPEGMRLFEVFVDGRVANDVAPSRAGSDDESWEIRLLDVGWPRSIVAVFAGEVPGGLPVGGTLDLEMPAVAGLPCRRAVWVLELPRGVVARFRPPAAAIDGVTLVTERSAAVERMSPAFDRAIGRAVDEDATRLAELLRQRRRDVGLPLPAFREETAARILAWGDPLRLVVPAASAGESPLLRVSIVRLPDASVAGRAWATALLLAGFAGLVELRRRSPAVSRWTARFLETWWAPPAAAIVVAAAWVAWLDPAWPGWCAAGVAVLALLARMPRRRFAADARRAAMGSTATLARKTGEAGAIGSTVRPG